ncbi:MAG: hypothetical protein NTX79_04550 [Candidatus Micrarchaeota archaeon]|nr:hypothetical protein [Candidatus Micrarchaeota archaeon]
MSENANVVVIDGKGKGAPDYVVKTPTDDGKWVKLGVAFFNPKSQSFTIYFDILPNRQKAVMFKR